MRLSSLLLLGFLDKTEAAIGDGRLLARAVMPYTVCEAKQHVLELGEYIPVDFLIKTKHNTIAS